MPRAARRCYACAGLRRAAPRRLRVRQYAIAMLLLHARAHADAMLMRGAIARRARRARTSIDAACRFGYARHLRHVDVYSIAAMPRGAYDPL